MKQKLTKIISLSSLIILYLLNPGLAIASPTTTTATVSSKINWPVPDEMSTVPKMISTLSNILFPLVGLVLFFMIVYGGITKMTAAGDADKEKQAMQIIKNSVIGAVIIILARVIVDTISSLLGAPGL